MKALLYCTKRKPYLYGNGDNIEFKREYYLSKRDLCRPYVDDISLNGTVCFECEIEKAEEIRRITDLSLNWIWKTNTQDELHLLKRSCLNHKEMADYSPRHALYLKNVKAIKPFPITALARRDPTGLNIAEGLASGMFRAPQNMCWAWRWNDKGWERVLVLSLRPKHLCNIANGLKDIETRRQVVNEIKEMEK